MASLFNKFPVAQLVERPSGKSELASGFESSQGTHIFLCPKLVTNQFIKTVFLCNFIYFQNNMSSSGLLVNPVTAKSESGYKLSFKF